ncbi:MAG: hypothetical protein HC927_09330, partial [Deltaproteobacteria bacterium]|nr:hypothetical protein [Deltaproteobacteria bacterium]
MGKGKNKAKNKAKRAKQAKAAKPMPVERRGPREVLVGLRHLGLPNVSNFVLLGVDGETGEILTSQPVLDEPGSLRAAFQALLERHPTIRRVYVDDEDLVQHCPSTVDRYVDRQVGEELDALVDRALADSDDPSDLRVPDHFRGLLELGVERERIETFYAAAERLAASPLWRMLEDVYALEFEHAGTTWVVSLSRDPTDEGWHMLQLLPGFTEFLSAGALPHTLSRGSLGVVWQPLEQLSGLQQRELQREGWSRARRRRAL